MKYTNEKMTWNTQDTNLSWYVPKANLDHTISAQGTADSTLDHSASTPLKLFTYLQWMLILISCLHLLMAIKVHNKYNTTQLGICPTLSLSLIGGTVFIYPVGSRKLSPKSTWTLLMFVLFFQRLQKVQND